MSLTFPASPTVGDTYTVGARTWSWSGTIWEITGTVAAAGSIGTAELADSSITTAKIAAGAVAEADIADGAVTSAKIAAGAVVEADIASNAVTTAKIADANVTAVKLASNAVETAKIADANVTTAKIADANITAAKLASSLPRGVVAYVRQESGAQSANSMFGAIIGLNTFTTTFTPVAGRLYRCTYSIGNITQPSSPGAIIINLLKETSSTLDISNLFESTTNIVSHTRVITLTSSQLGTSPTYLGLSAQTDTSVTVTPSSTRPTIIIVEDIGLA
jgi:hypothetical protein